MLDAALATTKERLDRLTEQREPLETRRRDLDARERDLDGETKLVRARTERLLSDAAAEAVRAAADEARAADAEHNAWQLVDTLIALSESEGELAGLAERVEKQERGVADARSERRDAALALAGALLHEAAVREAEADALAARLADAESAQERLRGEIEALSGRGGELKQRRGTLEAQLDGFARATERLRSDEVLRDGERPSAAAERFEAEREDLIGQRHELAERLREVEVRRVATRQRLEAAEAEAAEQAAAANELARRRDAAVARVASELGDRPAPPKRGARRRPAAAEPGAEISLFDALDVAADWQPLDEPAGAELALERARAAADGRRATLANELDARAADERALERDGLLAVESDVERICDELEAIGMQAQPALRHLADRVRADRLPALIAAQPGLAAGIVLLDGDPAEALLELRAARVRPPRRPLLLAHADEVLVESRADAEPLPARTARPHAMPPAQRCSCRPPAPTTPTPPRASWSRSPPPSPS